MFSYQPKTYLNSFSIGTYLKKQIVVKNETFYNDESGFGTYLVENTENELGINDFRISGVFVAPLILGQTYEIKGIITEYKGEKQVRIETIRSIRPINKKGIISYLKSLKGLKSKAEAIYDVFGEDCINVLINTPLEVSKQIPGIGKKSVEKWKIQLDELSESQEIISTLLGYGISTKESKKLYDKYKESIIQKIEFNPYFLIKEVKGYGFEKCDRIARELSFAPTCDFRIKEGIIHTLKMATLEGHCYLPMEELLKKSKNILDIKLSFIEMEKYKKMHTGKKSFDYYIGEKLKYVVDYTEMLGNLNSYKSERASTKKECFRHLIVDVPLFLIKDNIKKLFLEKEIMIDGTKIYLDKFYKDELAVSENVKRLNNLNEIHSKEEVETVLNEILKEKDIELEENQRKACIEFNLSSNGFFILSGSAGTGKTFTLLLILEVHKRLQKKTLISIFAPTGRASKVASIATKMPCSTIHKGLGFNPVEGGFEYNLENQLSTDIVVCDEASMLDISLARNFFEAINEKSKIIIMGDTKQLPSVGAGNLLKDLVDSNKIKIITLNVIKRQGELSGIVYMANSIINGEMVQTAKTKDAFVLKRESVVGVQTAIIESIKRVLTFEDYSFEDIQVLIPQRTGSLGTYLINYLIQKEFNKDNSENKILSRKFSTKLNENDNPVEIELYFKKNDKVIHTKNNYDIEHYQKLDDNNFKKTEKTGITNGETGIIEYIKIEKDIKGKVTKKLIMVKYDDFYCLYEDEFNELEHSYAMTVHKSQGSAWKCIITPVTNSYWNMLENNIFYTAVTRSRDFLVVIGSDKAFRHAIDTHKSKYRYTNLKERILI